MDEFRSCASHFITAPIRSLGAFSSEQHHHYAPASLLSALAAAAAAAALHTISIVSLGQCAQPTYRLHRNRRQLLRPSSDLGRLSTCTAASRLCTAYCGRHHGCCCFKPSAHERGSGRQGWEVGLRETAPWQSFSKNFCSHDGFCALVLS